jgi:hypothetical protein
MERFFSSHGATSVPGETERGRREVVTEVAIAQGIRRADEV